jgi:hypothetical protein
MKQIEFLGIARNVEPRSIIDGACNNIINLRQKNGSWEPVLPKKPFLANLPDYDSGYVHKTTQGDVLLLWRQEADEIVWGMVNDWPAIPNKLITIETFSIRFESVGNILVIASDQGLLYNLWKQDHYINLQSVTPEIPRIDFSPAREVMYSMTATNVRDLNFAEKVNAIEGQLFKKMAEWNESGNLYGFVLIQYAFELFDGSYIKHSCPQLVWMGGKYEPGYVHTADTLTVRYPAANCQYAVAPGSEQIIQEVKDSYSDIIKGIAIFMSRPHLGWMFDGSVPIGNTNEALAARRDTGGYTTRNYEENHGKNPAFVLDPNATPDELVKQQLLYKIASIPIENIETATIHVLDVGNIDHFVTKEVLPVDDYSHHSYSGKTTFSYNNRLILASVSTMLYGGYSPHILSRMVNTGTAREVCFEVELVTGDGKKIVRSEIQTNSDIELYLPLVIAYPDSRAKIFRVLIRPDGESNFRVLYELKLQGHSLANMAYGICGLQSKNVNVISYDGPVEVTNPKYRPSAQAGARLAATTMVNQMGYMDYPADLSSLPEATWYADNIVRDRNRMQATKTNNPFLFPAVNSYRIGKDEIIAVSANTIPISTGQFGQYPLIAFTRSGIWALNIGTGEVFVHNIVPLNGYVCNNPESVTQLENAIIFTSDSGLMILTGGEVRDISDVVEGEYHPALLTNGPHASLTNNDLLVHLPQVPTIDFKEFLKEAIIAYDSYHKEVIISNKNYSCSYIYGTESGRWSTIDQVFDKFVYSYPYTYAKPTGSNSLCVLHKEQGDYVTAYIESQPIKLDPGFKVLERSQLNCFLKTQPGKHAGLYVFGSYDGMKWHMICGVQKSGQFADPLIERSASSMKYFIFVFAGVISKVSRVNYLLTTHKSKYVNKLR